LDHLESAGQHTYRLHWLLADVPHTFCHEHLALTLETEAGPYSVCLGLAGARPDVSLVRGAEASPRGWQAPYYAAREPALSLAVMARAESILFWTLLGPAPTTVSSISRDLEIGAAAWNARVRVEDMDAASIVGRVELRGSVEDALELTTEHRCTS
jgi:hypothetical protein